MSHYLVVSREQKATAVAASANFSVATVGQGSDPALGDQILTLIQGLDEYQVRPRSETTMYCLVP